MRMSNYSSLFSYHHDNHFKEEKEEVLLYLHYYFNFCATLYYTKSEIMEHTFNYIFQPYSYIMSICYK
jgi:hypothetical protein